MSESSLVIDAGVVLTPFERFSPGRIVTVGGRIEAAGRASDVRVREGAVRVDASRLTVVPGFIEPHLHGCGGVDVMDATRDSMNTISRTLARHGTTSFLPTTVSAPLQTLNSVIERLGGILEDRFDGATPLGLHLEGPFINVHRRGTHRADNVQAPDTTMLGNWIARSKGRLKLLTLAPELEGVGAVADLARASGITVGMGHSDASFETASDAAAQGIRYAVHTFNAMRPFSHRDPGIVGAVLSDHRIFAEIIADGAHVAPPVVYLFARAKGPSRVILATDGTSATGMPDGSYALGKDMVRVEGGICRDDEGRLAGSTLTQDAALRNFMQWSGMRIEEAILGLTANPAQALALEGRGRIEAGAGADLTFLDSDLRVARTFVAGKLVFERILAT